MLRFLGRIKERLSNIKDTDWHYQVVELPFHDAENGKACSYYWLKLPFALLWWCFLCIVAVMLFVGGLFFGYVVTFFPTKNIEFASIHDNKVFYPYKRFPNGKRMPVAPWEVVALIGVLSAVYYLAVVDREAGIITAGILLTFPVLAGVLWVLTKAWKNPVVAGARSNLTALYNRVCPDLHVEHVSKD